MARDLVNIRSLARVHTETCIRVLAGIVAKGESESARIAAANLLLERAYGKAPTMIEGDADIRVTIRHILQTGAPQLNPGDEAKLINGGDNDRS